MAPHPNEALRSQQLRNWAPLRRQGREGRICAHIWEPAVSKALPAVQVEGPIPQSPNWLPSRQTLPRNHRLLERIFPKSGAFHSLGVCLRRMGHLISDNRTQSRAREEKDESPGKGHRHPYRGGGIWLGPMLEQDINDVCVALLGSLVQRCVAIL